ncbi:hypothetical protein Tco_0476402 [Tanacetum coccineum]
MAFTVNLSPVPLRSPEFSASRNSSPKPIISFTRKRPVLSFAATQPPTTTPEIELEFIGMNALCYMAVLDEAKARGRWEVSGGQSGGSERREASKDYHVVEGQELLNERTNAELKYLKKVFFLQHDSFSGSNSEASSMEEVISRICILVFVWKMQILLLRARPVEVAMMLCYALED